MITGFLVWLFKLNGWRVGETIPSDIRKCIVIAAPHTSSWDFVYSLAAFKILGLPVKYLAKKELFKFPFKAIFDSTGGIPVERSKSQNLVESIVARFNATDRLYLLMAAEGTRKKVDKWKSGFYYAALGAGVPVMLGYLDYKNKIAGLGEVVYLTGNKEKDMERIRRFYSDKTPRNPELFNLDSVKLD